jgi:hypothetical protein
MLTSFVSGWPWAAAVLNQEYVCAFANISSRNVKDMIAHVLQPTGEEKTDSGNKSERTNLSFAGAIQSTLYKAEMASKMFMFQ